MTPALPTTLQSWGIHSLLLSEVVPLPKLAAQLISCPNHHAAHGHHSIHQFHHHGTIMANEIFIWVFSRQ